MQNLLRGLALHSATSISRVVLTLNTPESAPLPPKGGWPFELSVIRNVAPRGFGANHNSALLEATENLLCVLNPDAELLEHEGDAMSKLAASALAQGVGCAYPQQVDSVGGMQDSERELPTPSALWRRRVLGKRESRVDWVNAACMVLPREAWVAVGGFDERYFMYCEDVDLCLRLRQAGYLLARAPVQIVHSGQRASRRRWDHLRWHVASLLRLWRSPAYRWACNALPAAGAGADNIGAS